MNRYTFYLLDFCLGLFAFILFTIGYSRGGFWFHLVYVNDRKLLGLDHYPAYRTEVGFLFFRFTIWKDKTHADNQPRPRAAN